VPPLTLPEAERIARRLAGALDAHNAWIRRVHTRLICGPPAPEAAPAEAPGNDADDDLGRWFDDETSRHIRRHPEFVAAAHHHRRVHETARAMRRAADERRDIPPADYEAFATAVQHLEHSLEALIGELWDLLRYTDPLTGIATRHAMLPRLREERNRSRRTGHRCSICMVDLDRFKQINDTYGHQAGDTVLKAVSAYFAENLRRYDQICRFGGEEFMIMLPDTDPASARPIVERLRTGLDYLPIIIENGQRLKMTASFGIAPLAAERSVRTSIERADQAMYRAKRAGRNQVRVWRPTDTVEDGNGDGDRPATANG